MLDIKFIRQNIDNIKKAMADRGENFDIKAFQIVDEKRRSILFEIETLRHRKNVATEQVAQMKKKKENTDTIVIEMRSVSDKIKDLNDELSENEETMNQILLNIPNIPHESVPIGKDSSQNPIVKKVGDTPVFDFEQKFHWDIGEKLKILDIARAAKITGARFMVNRLSMTNTGQLPKFKEDLFKLEGWDYFMVPTAEVPVTNIHQNEILDEDTLPIFYTAHTPCFRSEAGSYGKDTKGLIRQHQFNKVELVKFVKSESSYEELEKLLNDAETVLKNLELPYQVIDLCTGDLGFSAAKTYDIEVWMPGQGAYREISSCSNFEDFQARRANIRYKEKGRKGTRLVHTLNGSGLAVGRTVAALLENFQQPDGSVVIPEALRSYMNGMDKIQP
ncbi:MAG: serine--tRNA ligase [Deltaproteobacteria bacterium]|nr:serine--tRNA ligase [Deltaproteobacteria bacterium]